MAEELDYVPMPKKVVAQIEKVWANEIKDAKREAALHRRRDGALSSFDANSAGPAAVALRPARPLSSTGPSREYLARRPVDRLSRPLLGVYDGAC